jgi:hypothetical protein
MPPEPIPISSASISLSFIGAGAPRPKSPSPAVTFEVAQCAQALTKGFHTWTLRGWTQETDSVHLPHRLRLPCKRRDEDAGREGRDERASVHWMISSARASTDGGIVRPSAFAVFRLTTSEHHQRRFGFA